MSVATQPSGGPLVPLRAGIADEALVPVRHLDLFMKVQLFSLVYLQTFAVPVGGLSFSVPMLVMFAGIGAMALFSSLSIDRVRMAIFGCLLVAASFSQLVAAWSTSSGLPSVPSFAQLILLYGMMTIRWTASQEQRERHLRLFNGLMVVPCLVILFQLVWQLLAGGGNPLNIHALVPDRLLLPGYIYQAPYHWGESFIRPNGFFFLETSFASAFAATAAIIEMTRFKRPSRLALYIGATVGSLGGTGFTMLVLAAPFILVRQSWPTIFATLALLLGGIVLPVVSGTNLPFVSRVTEFDRADSSGSGRLLLPALTFLDVVDDPGCLVRGIGAGAISADAGSPWPMVKLASEYGLLTMLTFLGLILVSMSWSENAALMVPLFVTFNFTGGYLLNPVLIELIILLCTISAPVALSPPSARGLQPEVQTLTIGRLPELRHSGAAR